MAAVTPSSERPVHHPLRVLIADDNPDVLHDLRMLLELSEDIEIAGEADDGLEAVRLAARLQPDVILMDLEMPGMDGYQATRQIKTSNCACRVVILSVHTGPSERERARASGADEFVVKGCSYEVLRNAIRGKGESTSSSINPG